MTDVARRLFLALIMYFAADFAVPLEPGPGRFVIEDTEEAVAAPRSSARVRVVHAASAPPPLARQTFRVNAPPQPLLTHRLARREWQTPPPLRAVARLDRPAPPDAH